MIQKITKNNRFASWLAFVTSIFFLSFSTGNVFAQETASVHTDNAEAISASGTPVEEIISAADAGALSTSQSFSELKSAADEAQANDSPSPSVPAQPSQPDPPAFTPDSLKNLESQGGLSTSPQIDSENPTVFKLAVKFFERVVFQKDTEFMKRPMFDNGMDISGTPTFDQDTAGYAVIKKGNQSVAVDFQKNYDVPPVITATLSLEQYDDPDVRAAAQDLLLVSDVKYIVSSVSKKGFEIMMDRKADSDIPFSWHALAVDNPKTFKKKGETQKNGILVEPDSSDASADLVGAGSAIIPPDQNSSAPGTGGN